MREQTEAAVLTLLSPPDTARIFAVMDQLTCQTTSLNLCSNFGDHEFPEASSHVQINTLPSYTNKQTGLAGRTKTSLFAFPIMTALPLMWALSVPICIFAVHNAPFSYYSQKQGTSTAHSYRSLTCEQLAMVLVGKPMDGAQATSRTQSLCASSFCSSFHWPSSSLKIHLHSWKDGSSASCAFHLLFWETFNHFQPPDFIPTAQSTNVFTLLQKAVWLKLTKSLLENRMQHIRNTFGLQLLYGDLLFCK